mmetsp:Transcript_25167/g.68199  ORF Transcript_25167/g.68199 Transcript_25167/m.68199 type:complete len:316 (-) Transcript_25167:404-1351(-)
MVRVMRTRSHSPGARTNAKEVEDQGRRVRQRHMFRIGPLHCCVSPRPCVSAASNCVQHNSSALVLLAAAVLSHNHLREAVDAPFDPLLARVVCHPPVHGILHSCSPVAGTAAIIRVYCILGPMEGNDRHRLGPRRKRIPQPPHRRHCRDVPCHPRGEHGAEARAAREACAEGAIKVWSQQEAHKGKNCCRVGEIVLSIGVGRAVLAHIESVVHAVERHEVAFSILRRLCQLRDVKHVLGGAAGAWSNDDQGQPCTSIGWHVEHETPRHLGQTTHFAEGLGNIGHDATQPVVIWAIVVGHAASDLIPRWGPCKLPR